MKKLIIVAVITLLANFANAGFHRWIKNDSNKTWSISHENYYSCRNTFFLFDSDSDRGPASCHVSAPNNYLCILKPGEVTYVYYGRKPRGKMCGELVFSVGSSSKEIIVKYRENTWDNGVQMQSSSPNLINDNHGDITIYKIN